MPRDQMDLARLNRKSDGLIQINIPTGVPLMEVQGDLIKLLSIELTDRITTLPEFGHADRNSNDVSRKLMVLRESLEAYFRRP